MEGGTAMTTRWQLRPPGGRKKRLRVQNQGLESSPKEKKSFSFATSRAQSKKKKKKKKASPDVEGEEKVAEKAERVLWFRYEETVTGLREPFRL